MRALPGGLPREFRVGGRGPAEAPRLPSLAAGDGDAGQGAGDLPGVAARPSADGIGAASPGHGADRYPGAGQHRRRIRRCQPCWPPSVATGWGCSRWPACWPTTIWPRRGRAGRSGAGAHRVFRAFGAASGDPPLRAGGEKRGGTWLGVGGGINAAQPGRRFLRLQGYRVPPPSLDLAHARVHSYAASCRPSIRATCRSAARTTATMGLVHPANACADAPLPGPRSGCRAAGSGARPAPSSRRSAMSGTDCARTATRYPAAATSG